MKNISTLIGIGIVIDPTFVDTLTTISDVIVSGNTQTVGATFIECSSTGAATLARFDVSDNTAAGVILFDESSTTLADELSISNNKLRPTSAEAIDVRDWEGVEIINNKIDGTTLPDGIQVLNATLKQACNISGNRISGAVDTAAKAISATNVSMLSITDNRIGRGGAMTYAVYVSNTVAAANTVSVRGNSIHGTAVTIGVQIETSKDISALDISGNNINGSLGTLRGIYITASSSAIISRAIINGNSVYMADTASLGVLHFVTGGTAIIRRIAVNGNSLSRVGDTAATIEINGAGGVVGPIIISGNALHNGNYGINVVGGQAPIAADGNTFEGMGTGNTNGTITVGDAV